MQLTIEQQDFLNSEGRIILCAVPGSGKTFIVVKKLIRYLEEWNLSHQGIAALSFTNVASNEIKRQLIESNKNLNSIGYPHFIGTLDSFINNYIFLRFGYLMQSENRTRPKIIHENYYKQIIPLGNSECYKRGCIQHPEWFHWSSTGLLKNGKPIECNIATNKPCFRYKKSLIKKGIVSQREVSSLSLRLLNKYPIIASLLAHRFPVIIVDEAQDTSFEQMEILNLISKAGVKTITLVGDPDQTLYEWRDATPEYFKKIMMDIQWSCKYLTSNFRSSQYICNATQLFSSILKEKSPASAQGDFANFNKKPLLLIYSKEKSKNNIYEFFVSLCCENDIPISPDKVAILTRGKIYSDLATGIWKTRETELLAKASYYWYCSNRREAYRFCQEVLYSIEIGDPTELTQDEILYKAEERFTHSKWKTKVIELLKILPSPSLTILEWKKQLSAGIERQLKSSAIIPYDGRKLSDIVKFKTRDSKYPDFMNHIFKNYFEKKVQSQITISSVHGVKGETFDAVLLLIESTRGANTLTPTTINNSALDSELTRIAYVAMTRPRKLLVVAIPKTKTSLTRFPKELWEHKEI